MSESNYSRRQVLRYGAATAGVAAIARAGVGSAWAQPGTVDPMQQTRRMVNGLPVPASWKAVPFSLDQVELSDSIFTGKRDRMLAYARAYPADRILSNFRRTAGLDTRGAQPPGGWDDATGNLRGHYSGHFLSLLAQAYAGTGEPVFKEKLDYIVTGLKECQDALDAQVGRPGTPPPPATWAEGRFGGGLLLNGNGQYVGLPDSTVDGLRDFTIGLWVNLRERRTWSRAFDFGTGTRANMFLTIDAGSGPRFAITTNGSGGEQKLQGPTRLQTGRWTHLAVTHQGSTGTLYVDGVPVATNDAMTLSPADLGAPKNNWIGRSQYGDAMLNGTVDDFNLFDRALDATAVAALATGPGGGPGGNRAWYRFDETSGTAVPDSSGREWDAAVVTGSGGDPGPSHVGFLAAYPETQFIKLEEYTTYPAIWAPYYTCHKIMRGLLDAHGLTGNETALEVVSAMGDWVHSRLSKLPREQLDRMWALYIAGEYGGMNEVMADLYSLTGEQRYLDTARCFDNTKLLADCAADRDTLDGKHANQHIPQFIGYLRVFEQGGEKGYREAARHFFDMVVPHRTYVHGGTGQGEIFRARDKIAGTIVEETNAESCAAYNMLKVARNLFFHAPDARFMDYYEKALVNQILASRRDTDSLTDPLVNYMVPVGPGATRDYGNTGTCCGGTGLENHTKYQDSIYFRSADEGTLFVNLYVPSMLHWAERGLTVTQSGSFPTAGRSTLTMAGRGHVDLRLRVPSWSTGGFTVRVNGHPQPVRAGRDGYARINRMWHDGDTIDVRFPFTLRVEETIDDPSLQGLAYGPVALIAKAGGSDYRTMAFYDRMGLSGSLKHSVTPTGAAMVFESNGMRFEPFYLGNSDPYHAYLRRREPTIVFGGSDSGVENRAGDDGRTFLDAVWSAAPFRDLRALERRVQATAATWEAAGLLSAAERETVEATLREADVPED